MPESCPPLSQVLLEVKQELWQRYASLQSVVGGRDKGISRATCGKTLRGYSKSCLSTASEEDCSCSYSSKNDEEQLPSIVLDALDDEDWNSIIYPVSELKPYLNCVAPISSPKRDAFGLTNKASSALGGSSSHLSILEYYTQCRCAELPMRLQTEALVLRRHEEARRQYMTQLILLSQFIAYWVPSSSDSTNGSNGSILSTDGPSECSSHMQRCQQRIPELEQKIMTEVMAKRKCSQRMILMSAVAYALVSRLGELEEDASRSFSKRKQQE